MWKESQQSFLSFFINLQSFLPPRLIIIFHYRFNLSFYGQLWVVLYYRESNALPYFFSEFSRHRKNSIGERLQSFFIHARQVTTTRLKLLWFLLNFSNYNTEFFELPSFILIINAPGISALLLSFETNKLKYQQVFNFLYYEP